MPPSVGAGGTDHTVPSESAGGVGREGHDRPLGRLPESGEDERAHLESGDGEGMELMREVDDRESDRDTGSKREIGCEDLIAGSDSDRDVLHLRRGTLPGRRRCGGRETAEDGGRGSPAGGPGATSEDGAPRSVVLAVAAVVVSVADG